VINKAFQVARFHYSSSLLVILLLEGYTSMIRVNIPRKINYYKKHIVESCLLSVINMMERQSRA